VALKDRIRIRSATREDVKQVPSVTGQAAYVTL
jgi:hypothetical protein